MSFKSLFSFLMFPIWRVSFKEKYTSKFTHGDIKLIYCQVNVEGPHPDPSLAEFRRTINLDRILTSIIRQKNHLHDVNLFCLVWNMISIKFLKKRTLSKPRAETFQRPTLLLTLTKLSSFVKEFAEPALANRMRKCLNHYSAL